MQCFIFHIVLILVALDFVRAFIATEPVAEKIRAGDIKEKLGESNHRKKMEYQKDAVKLCRGVLANYDQCKKLEMKEKLSERQTGETEDRTLEKYKRAIRVLARLASQLKREKKKNRDVAERSIDDLPRLTRF